jgi:hypothetical protein
MVLLAFCRPSRMLRLGMISTRKSTLTGTYGLPDYSISLPLDSNRKPPAPPPNGMNVHDYVEELNQEISQYIGMLYFVVEVFRSDESFGDELSEYDHLTGCN